MSLRKPIRFISFGGYKRFSTLWWDELVSYTTGLSICPFYHLSTPGWCRDIYTYWHRARYGWAPRDTWNLDGYLNRTFAGTLDHLAEHGMGCPQEYFDDSVVDHECHRWRTQLKKWAHAFNEDPSDVNIYDRDNDYADHNAEETRRRDNLHRTLKELEPMWECLWD